MGTMSIVEREEILVAIVKIRRIIVITKRRKPLSYLGVEEI